MRARAKVVPETADTSSVVMIDDGREIPTDRAEFDDECVILSTFPEALVEEDRAA
jgi:hypothetical protein